MVDNGTFAEVEKPNKPHTSPGLLYTQTELQKLEDGTPVSQNFLKTRPCLEACGGSDEPTKFDMQTTRQLCLMNTYSCLVLLDKLT